MRKTILMLAAVLVLCLTVSACGNAAPEQETALSQTETSVDSTANHPVRPYAGIYTESQTGQGSVEITLKENDSAFVVVRWIAPDGNNTAWHMSGVFDEKKKTIKYENGFKQIDNIGEDGAPAYMYHDATGTFTFTDEGLLWEDDEEHFADDMVFIRVSQAP